MFQKDEIISYSEEVRRNLRSLHLAHVLACWFQELGWQLWRIYDHILESFRRSCESSLPGNPTRTNGETGFDQFNASLLVSLFSLLSTLLGQNKTS